MNSELSPKPASFDGALTLVTEIVSAYVGSNPLPAADLPAFIASVHAAITSLQGGTTAAAPALEPAVPVKKSVTKDFIVCLEDGKKFKSLRRHLASAFSMTPEQYRTKWNLPTEYPMTAPGYAAVRSQLARQAGLGTRATAKRVAPAATVGGAKVSDRRVRPRKVA